MSMPTRVVWALSLAASIVASGCGGSDGSSGTSVGSGGEATILLEGGFAGAWPTGLDPATNTTARANLSLMNAIYGGLFQLIADEDGGNPSIAGVLATGYEIVDEGRTIVIHLREGVTFSDQTPFDAEAVRLNMERNLGSSCTCAPTSWPWVSENRITIEGDHSVALHFSRPYASIINAFPVSNLNWIASPAALQRMGEDRFKVMPVGAGPFRVVSNQLSSKLVLERNPTYWQHERPYLNRLTFQSINSEHAAFQTILAGDAHAYEGMTSTLLIQQAKKDERLQVTQQNATSSYVIQLNTTRPPFNDPRAREVLYYATDVETIRKALFSDLYSVGESFTGPGGLFYHERIPGYRTYDLERARALVNELGGLQFDLGTLRSFVAEQVVTALQSQWEKAGITTSIELRELPTMIQAYRSGEWQAMLQTVGAYDPEAGVGVSGRFRSDGIYSGVKDPKLDEMLVAASETFDVATRGELYFQAAKYISDNAYAPFLFAFAPTQLAVRGISGPGLTTRIPPIFVNAAVLWQDVRVDAE